MNPRLALLLSSLYIAQGLPSGFFAHALPVLLREQGVSLTAISLAKLLALPWFFKFLWAPTVDRVGLGQHSHYRHWILAMQTVGLLAVTALSVLPAAQWFTTYLPFFLVTALLVNTFLATQDIATDALAVKLLSPSERGPGNSIQVAGYKLGMLAGGNGLLILLAEQGLQNSFRWLAIGLLLLMLPILLFREPAGTPHHSTADNITGSTSFSSTWRTLLALPGMTLWLPVLMSYKIADSMASAMIRPLLVDVGFPREQIGQIGMVASIAGMVAAFVGGLGMRRLGSWHALMIFGVLQAAGLAAWALVAIGWHSPTAVYGIAVFEQMADAMSTVALFAMMMGFCRANHEGGDYTLQMSLFMVVSGTLGLAGGAIADVLGATGFFITMALLGLFCQGWVWRGLRLSAPGFPDRPA